ncbi:MAG: superoxide dismutase [Bdellovibrionales bacterium]|nr:superoxide dismutase [Bdellovibrionales bacterium]
MFKLPEFNFTKASFLSEETIQYHYGKHHNAYIEKLNNLMEGLPPKDILEIIRDSDGALYNNAAQSWNHTFYWMGLTPSPSSLNLNSLLEKSIKEQFGSESGLKEKFVESALKVFGSGWTWLALDMQGKKIEIINTSNADVIDFKKYMPLLICDIWEHAYYIDYRNSRSNYLAEFWTAINWKFVEDNFENKDQAKVGKLLMT